MTILLRDIVPPHEPRDTLPCPPDLDDLDGEPADSGVHVIDPQRAAQMRAEWAALWTDVPDPTAALDAETSTPTPGSLYR
jgi:hypothetical protein